VVLFALLFFFRQRSEDLSRERLAATAARAESGTARVEALVRTMPPHAFQTQLAQMVDVAHRGMAKVLPRGKQHGLSKDDLVKFIRVLLNSIARLALIYDDQPLTLDGSATYSASIMLFVPLSPSGIFPQEVLSVLRFYPKEYDLTKLSGALVLRQELSATSATADLPGPDINVPTIALPVPLESMTDGRWNALPGAPKALLSQKADGYDDAMTLGDWCTQSGNFPPSVVEDLRRYFATGDGREIRSFISRPLAFDGGGLGVLNLHSNRTDILGDADERMPAFLAMMTPLFLELQSALDVLGRFDELTTPGAVADDDH
jgi:hypothetical protein